MWRVVRLGYFTVITELHDLAVVPGVPAEHLVAVLCDFLNDGIRDRMVRRELGTVRGEVALSLVQREKDMVPGSCSFGNDQEIMTVSVRQRCNDALGARHVELGVQDVYPEVVCGASHLSHDRVSAVGMAPEVTELMA